MKTILITASNLSPVGINTILSLNKYYRIVCVDIKSKDDNISYYFGKQYYEVPLAKEGFKYIKKIIEKSCKWF